MPTIKTDLIIEGYASDVLCGVQSLGNDRHQGRLPHVLPQVKVGTERYLQLSSRGVDVGLARFKGRIWRIVFHKQLESFHLGDTTRGGTQGGKEISFVTQKKVKSQAADIG